MKTIYYSFLSVSIIFCVGFKLHAEDLESTRVQVIEDYLSSIRYDNGKSVLSAKEINAETLSFAETKQDVDFLENTYKYFREIRYLVGGAQLFDKYTAVKKAVAFTQTKEANPEKLEKLKQMYGFVSQIEIPQENSSILHFPKYVFKSQQDAFEVALQNVDQNISLDELKAAYRFFANLRSAHQQFIFERIDAFQKAKNFTKEGKDLEQLKKSYEESYAKLKGTSALAKDSQLALLKAEQAIQKEDELKRKTQEATAQAEEILKPLAATTCLDQK